MKQHPGYIPSLDGIRSFALLAVLFYHLIPSVFKGGYLGVVIFFVLAGFLSMQRVMQAGRVAEGRLSMAGKAFGKKLLKLYPALLLMIACVSLVIFLFFPSQLGGVESDIKGAVFSVNNYSQILSGDSYFENSGALKPFTHIWALSLEVQVYLLIYAFLYGRYRRERSFRTFLFLVFLSLLSYGISLILLGLGYDFTQVYYGLATRLYSFSLGAAASFFASGNGEARELLRPAGRNAGIAALCLLLGVSVFVFEANRFVFYFGFFLYSLLSAVLLVLLCSERSSFYKAFSAKPFSFLTARSYHIYLWHFPIIALQDRFFANRELSKALYYLIFFVLCAALSELSYRITAIAGSSPRAKRVFLPLALCLSLTLLLLPYRKISANTAESKALSQMKEQILQNEARQKIEQAEQKKAALKEKKRAFVESRRAKAAAESGTQQTSEAETQEKPPLLLLALSHIEWVNGLQDEFLYLDPAEYEKYKDVEGLLIGDSIASMSYHTLATYLPNFQFDSEHSREMATAYEAFAKYRNEDFGDYLILALGSNGETKHEDIEKVRRELKGRKLILLSIVLPYKDEEESRNKSIRTYAEAHEDVYLVDWHRAAKKRPEVFFDDKIHPGEDGAKILGQILSKQLIALEKAKKKGVR